jgi:hypothetical protein
MLFGNHLLLRALFHDSNRALHFVSAIFSRRPALRLNPKLPPHEDELVVEPQCYHRSAASWGQANDCYSIRQEGEVLDPNLRARIEEGHSLVGLCIHSVGMVAFEVVATGAS